MTSSLPQIRRSAPAIALVTAALLAVGSVSATAGSLITGAQIKNGTVTTKDVKDGNLKLDDLSADARSGLKGATGPAGATGATGAAGAPGAKGSSGYEVVISSASVPDASTGTVVATCPAGKVPLSGGYTFPGGVTIQQSAVSDTTGAFLSANPKLSWAVRVANTSGSSRSVFVEVVCLTAP